jgi:hypothetical protein
MEIEKSPAALLYGQAVMGTVGKVGITVKRWKKKSVYLEDRAPSGSRPGIY